MSGVYLKIDFQADGSAIVRGRLVSDEGTGTATGVSGEGNWVKQADLTSIIRTVYDKSSSTPSTSILTTTLALATVVHDTPVTDGVAWSKDSTGWNFVDKVPKTAFPTAEHFYRVKYTIQPTAGADYEYWDYVEGSATRGVPA